MSPHVQRVRTMKHEWMWNLIINFLVYTSYGVTSWKVEHSMRYEFSLFSNISKGNIKLVIISSNFLELMHHCNDWKAIYRQIDERFSSNKFQKYYYGILWFTVVDLCLPKIYGILHNLHIMVLFILTHSTVFLISNYFPFVIPKFVCKLEIRIKHNCSSKVAPDNFNFHYDFNENVWSAATHGNWPCLSQFSTLTILLPTTNRIGELWILSLYVFNLYMYQWHI